MAGRFQRLAGVVINILGISLLIRNVVWLWKQRPWKFLPEQVSELQFSAGSVELAISFERLAYFLLALSIFLICFGTFLIWRARSNRLRS